MDERIAKRVLGLVGLGIRARTAVVGVDKARDAARKGTLVMALVADDAAANSLNKILPLLRAKNVSVLAGFSAEALGGIAGRDTTAAIGILDPRLAEGIREVLQANAAGVSQTARGASEGGERV
jgi:ribosomal protein L7Ae-like RNA K-turn-binding protein